MPRQRGSRVKTAAHATRDVHAKYTHHELESLRAAVRAIPSSKWQITLPDDPFVWKFAQIILLNVCRPCVLVLEFALNKSEMLLRLVKKRIGQVTSADPNKQIVILSPKISVKSTFAKLIPNFVGKWRVSAKCNAAIRRQM
jgi:hypothetical protein